MGFSLSHRASLIFTCLFTFDCHQHELIAVHHYRSHRASCLGLVRRQGRLPWIIALVSNPLARCVGRRDLLLFSEEIAQVRAAELDIGCQLLLVRARHPVVICEFVIPFHFQRRVVDVVHDLSLSHISRTQPTHTALLTASRAPAGRDWRSFWRLAAADGDYYFLWAVLALTWSDRLTLQHVAEIPIILHVFIYSMTKGTTLKRALTNLINLSSYIS